MSEKAAWRKHLLVELGELLAPHGFKFVAARRSYRRDTATGWQWGGPGTNAHAK
jgi:hypothetical protein